MSFAELLGMIARHKGRIFLVIVAALALGQLYVLCSPAIYEANATLKVASTRQLAAAKTADEPKTPADQAIDAAEIKIINSRSVLVPVVHQLKLDIVAQPKFFPIIGKAIYYFQKDLQQPASPLWGLRQYAWGGEKIEVADFQVPSRDLNQAFSLVAKPGHHYQLYDANGQLLLGGQVGVEAVSSKGPVRILVSKLLANDGTRFSVTRLPEGMAALALRDSLVVDELGKQTGLLQISLDGKDPQRVAATVNAVAQIHQQLDARYSYVDVEHRLAFVNTQLPLLKVRLDTAEAALDRYETAHRTINTSSESDALIRKSSDIERDILTNELQRAELSEKFTDKHPAMQVVQQKIKELQQQRQAVNDRLAQLPGEELNITQLKRNMAVNADLYGQLLRQAQELKLQRAGIISSIHVVDRALVPAAPAKPNQPLTLALFAMLGAVGSILSVFLHSGANLPHKEYAAEHALEERFDLPVLARIPYSRREAGLVKAGVTGERSVLARAAPMDHAIENLRNLRTCLHFVHNKAGKNTIAIIGARCDIGKTFISVNLAQLIADTGKKVLLIDGDMRQGKLAQQFGLAAEGGLSDVIAGKMPLEVAIRHLTANNLHVLPSGTSPSHPSELLLSDRFARILQEARGGYDQVIVDTPPLLDVTDAAIIGQLADTVLLVAPDAEAYEIDQVMKRLAQNNIRLAGIILNEIRVHQNRDYRDYRYGRHPLPLADGVRPLEQKASGA